MTACPHCHIDIVCLQEIVDERVLYSYTLDGMDMLDHDRKVIEEVSQDKFCCPECSGFVALTYDGVVLFLKGEDYVEYVDDDGVQKASIIKEEKVHIGSVERKDD